jgi:putative ABC transport system permease protein
MAEQVRNPFNQNADTSSQRTDSRKSPATNGHRDQRHADAHAGRGAEPPRNQWRTEYLLQDVRFALRTLRKSWGFTLTAVLTLALGIGANTAIFQLLDAVRLRSLPVANPAWLAAVRVKSGTSGFGITSGGDYDTMLSYPMWEQIRLHQQSFSGVFAWTQSSWVSLGEGAQERRAQILWVSGEMFSVLGVPPLRGRVFTDKDDQPNCGLPGVVISYALWQSEFGGQDSAIGSRLIIEGHPTEVIGVTPRSFFGL